MVGTGATHTVVLKMETCALHILLEPTLILSLLQQCCMRASSRSLKESHQCFSDCGYSIQSSATPANVNECDMTCAGNSTQTCGGFWKIFIYSYGQPVTPVNKPLVNGLQYNGCYTYVLSFFPIVVSTNKSLVITTPLRVLSMGHFSLMN